MELQVKLQEYNSLQYRRWKETKEQILVVVIGALILGGWLLLVKNYSERPRQILGEFNSEVIANAIFLICIPDSIYAVLIRLLDVSRSLCITTCSMIIWKQTFIKNFPHHPIALENSTKVTLEKDARFFGLKCVFIELLATLVCLFFTCLSGWIGVEQTLNKISLEFFLSILLFWFEIIRLFLLIKRLLKTLMKILRRLQLS